MCKAIEVLSARKHAEGVAAGRSEGISIGRAEGSGRLVLTFMEKSKCDLETAMEFFNIEREEREGIIRFVEANR